MKKLSGPLVPKSERAAGTTAVAWHGTGNYSSGHRTQYLKHLVARNRRQGVVVEDLDAL